MGATGQLIEIDTPKVPANWNFEKSVAKTKREIYKWKSLTTSVAHELWIAREVLSCSKSDAAKIMHGTKVPCTWSDYCEAIGSSRQVVNRWLDSFFPKIDKPARTKRIAPPAGQYDLILIDPPWKYDFAETDSRKVENHYPTMDVDALCKLTLPAADDCLLLMWATAPKLIEAMTVIEAWGFTYKTHAIWDKEIIGMGYWFRGRHELLIVATCGDVPPPTEACRVASIFSERRSEHSAKPDCVYEWIEASFPDSTKCEMFARKSRDGWNVWGDEVSE